GKYTVTETNSDVEGYDLVKGQSTTSGEKAVVAGGTATVELKDVYEEKSTTGKLVIEKTVDGLNVTESEFEGALKFTVKNEDGKWLDKDGKVCDDEQVLTLKDFTKGDGGKYTLTFDEVEQGTYTVTETNSDVEGYDLVKGQSTTSGEKAVVAGGTATVELKDVYEEKAPETGDLKITKTFGGDVTKEEVAKGAITFEVKTADGKWLDKDGKPSDKKVELTLGASDGFVASADGLTWTKEFTGVPAGKYTVTESNSEIVGYELVKAESTVEAKDVEVTKSTVGDKAALAELKDVYEKKQEQGGPKKPGTTTGTKTGTTVSGGSLPKTGDPAAATGLATLYLSALGSGLLMGGLHLRRRRRKDGDE
ncbi:MAG: hypothetical protein IJ203_13470, partial [Atopobiaceae bacterium]|nr:hypothetical protein [Atopobiaceae bacterium]